MILESAINNTELYHCTTASRTIIGAKVIEFVQERVIKLSSIKKVDENDIIYRYELLGNKLKGTGLIHQWASDMEYVQDKLMFRVSPKGQLVDIVNWKEIKNKWKDYFKDKIAHKYRKHEGIDVLLNQADIVFEDKEKFLESFNGYNIYRFFFQGYYGYHEKQEKNDLIIKKFFGSVDLPLIVYTGHTTETETTFKHTINNIGFLNEEKFKRNDFSRMLKQISGVYNIDATLNLDMEETLIFNDDHWLTEGEMYLETQAANFYTVANAHKVQRISKEEKANLLSLFSKAEKELN